MRTGTVRRLTTGRPEDRLDEAGYHAFADSFVVADAADVTSTIAEFDAARTALLEVLRTVDPGEVGTEAAAPWHGIPEERPINLRFHLVHLIEECARHAGHADIVREQLDGMPVPALTLTLAGASANDFFQPYRAEPGTLLA